MDKQAIRDSVWKMMEENRVARFPGAKGRIPNFIGAEKCVGLVRELEVWRNAHVIKANPDSPQRAIRQLALKEGKIIYMAVPRLREEACFIELDPFKIGLKHFEASTIKGAFQHGRSVTLSEMRSVDLIVCGSVAVNRYGERVGKGGGYSDLEYALAHKAGKITPRTPIITTVHELQVVDTRIPVKPHDIPVDFIITPNRQIECSPTSARPDDIYWEFLDEEKINSIPALLNLAPAK